MTNTLYYGDNLDVLRRYVADESVDLVYLDPPFKSNQDYNVLFSEQDGTRSASQIHAFEDTWEWNTIAEATYKEVVQGDSGGLSIALRAFRALLRENDMMAYLTMMAPRLAELHRVLKATGSIYLHCDVTASAHLRLLMDAVFRPVNFRNEIIWYYYNKMHDSRKRLFPRAHDTILFYVKDVSADFTYHQLKEMRDTPVKQLLRKKVDGVMKNVKDDDGHVMYRLKEDRTLDNVWRIPCLQPAAQERLGFQTQKPEALLERIIVASSNKGDVVLDPFCGCGTTISTAQRLERNWIGIDVTHLAVGLIKHRLFDSFQVTAKKDYAVVGEPMDVQGAKQLANEDTHQFEHWALGQVFARSSAKGKGADKGIEGRLIFHDEEDGKKSKQVLFSVKSGNITVRDVRDLRGVIDREEAEIGVLISLRPTTGPMRTEAAMAGFYHSPWTEKDYPRLQLLTVEELLGGMQVDMPAVRQTSQTFKKAPKAKRAPKHRQKLIGDDE